MPFARTICLLITVFIFDLCLAQEGQSSSDLLGLHEASNQVSSQQILELWGYHNNNGSSSSNDIVNLRYYQPLKIENWRGTLRLDSSYISTYGPNQPNQFAGQYQAGTTMLTLWGNPPDLLKVWGGTLGGRIIFPFGTSGQWAIGPQIGTAYKPAERSKSLVSDFSPLARYMYGFSGNTTSASNTSQTTLLRNLYLFPTIGLNLSASTQIRFWDENGMVYNTAGGGWFVPLDAMLTQRISKHTLLAIGASKQIIQNYQQYNWSLYGKLSINF